MGLSITGYIDLSLTEHQFRDMIEKDINGELTCNNTNVKNDQNDETSRITRHVLNLPKVKEIVLKWNCSHAAEVLSTCQANFESIKSKDLGNMIFG